MYKIYLFLGLIISPLCAGAQLTNSVATPVATTIAQVTVFLEGAQIQRVGKATLDKGRNEFVFKALSPYLDKESIRLKGEGNFTVLSVNYGVNHLDEQQKRSEVELLKTKIDQLDKQIALENIGVDAWRLEVASLQKNDVVSSTQNGVKTSDLKELMDYRTARLRETNLKIYESMDKVFGWNVEKRKINAQLAEINAKSVSTTGEITVVVNAETNGNTAFGLSYSVAHASWQMSYDLRVKDVASPMNLLYKANVQQQTGEDWKDVKLVFSTGNPNYDNTQPTLDTWYVRQEAPPVSTVRFAPPVIVADKETKSIAGIAATTAGVAQADERAAGQGITYRGSRSDGNEIWIDGVRQRQEDDREESKARADKSKDQMPLAVAASQNITNTIYEVSLPYTVLNDGKTYTAEIRNGSVPAIYQYYIAPKKSTDAYLTALVTNWDELQLVSGEAALYYEGTYMGKTALNPDNTNDTLRISLGIDKGIVVQRNKLKEFAKKQSFGDKQSDERAYEIAIRNRHAQAVNLIVEDQFPVSAQREISVENIAYKEAKLDEKTGKLTWKTRIEGSKEQKFSLRYKIKYPKGWRVSAD